MTEKKMTTASGSLALGVALFVGFVALVCLSPLVPGDAGYEAGERAPRTLEAANEAQYESVAQTEQARELAAESVLPVMLPPDASVTDGQVDALSEMFESVRTVRARGLPAQSALSELASTPGPDLLTVAGRSALLTLDRTAFDNLQARAEKALEEIMAAGVAPPAAGTASSVSNRSVVPTVAQLVSDYMAQPRNNQGSVPEITALESILTAFVIPNIAEDAAETERLRDAARSDVAPTIVTFTRGQVVVSEGQVLTEGDIEALRETGLLSDRLDLYGLGAGVLVAAGFAVLIGGSMYLSGPWAAPAQRRALVSAGIIALALASIRVATPMFLPDTESHFLIFAIPIAAAPMVVTAYSNAGFGAIVASGLSLVGAFIVSTEPDIAGAAFSGSLQSLEVAVVFASSGVAGAFAMHRVDRMSRFTLGAFVVSIASGAALSAFWLLDVNRATEELGWMALVSGVHGLLSTVIAAGVFVVLSGLLGIPTRMQLMELADSGHPLQRRLRDEAPGTYHHSQMVGALAERAADRIGADVLLAKVGAYYHDTGKLSAPSMYIENMLDGGQSPHDSMSPVESAEIIRNHVTAGVQIARRYRLPVAVRAFIPEHHGTRLVTFFYRKAAENDENVDAALFSYAGPRPQTRESAIVMLADSCEALARAKQSSGESMDAIVDSIVSERLAEGQLDECDITLRELQEVAKSFKSTLRAVYHPRIEYPPALPDEVVALATGAAPTNS